MNKTIADMKNRCTFAVDLHFNQRRVGARKRAGFFISPQYILGDLVPPCGVLMHPLPLRRCKSTGKARSFLFNSRPKQNLFKMTYTEKGIEAKPSTLNPTQSQAIGQIVKDFFVDFSPEGVMEKVNDCYLNFAATDDYVDYYPTYRSDLAYTLHRLTTFLHQLHRATIQTPKSN